MVTPPAARERPATVKPGVALTDTVFVALDNVLFVMVPDRLSVTGMAPLVVPWLLVLQPCQRAG